jgi:uncharacterized protein YeaO (DUF488 family)
MLRQGSIQDVRSGRLTRREAYLVAAMCYYPRGLRRVLLDEYRSDLAPDRELFREWKMVERRSGHDEAFAHTRYEERFLLSAEAIAHLVELARLSREKDVVLLCQCGPGERCHREMLLLLAAELGARTAGVANEYPAWRRRIRALAGKRKDGAGRQEVKRPPLSMDSI